MRFHHFIRNRSIVPTHAPLIDVKNTAWLLLCLCLSTTLFFSFSPTTEAAILRQLPFSARLKTVSGAAVSDGNYSITFSIYTVESGGSAAWTETQTVSVTDGIISVNLGAVTSFSSSLTFNDDSYYLGIKVNSDPEMSPRKRIGSVPTALNADTVDGAHAGTSASEVLLLDSSGNINIQGAITTAGTLQAGSSTLTALTVANAASVGSTLAVAGNTTLTGDVAVNGGDITTTASTLTVAVANTGTIKFRDGTNTLFQIADNGSGGTVTVSGNILPATSATYNLGAPSATFANAYIDNLVVGTTSSSGTTGSSFTINSDGAGNADGTGTESSSVLFGRGSATAAQILYRAGDGAATGIAANTGVIDTNLPTRVITTLPATANYGQLSLGAASTSFDGSTSGYFAGSASGTFIAVNAASGFSGNLVDLQVAGLSKFSVTAAGNTTIGGTLTTSGTTTLNGTAAFNGATTIGDNGDTVAVNSSDWDISIVGALTGISGITTDGSYTQSGTGVNTLSGATSFTAAGTALSVTNDASIGGTLGVTGTATLQSTLGVSGLITATAGITSGNAIVSDTDSTDNLGSSTVAWANLYVDNIATTSGTSLTMQPATGITLFNTANADNIIRLYGDDGTDYIEVKHDATNAVITSNSGELQLNGAGTNQVIVGDAGAASNLVFEESSTISGQGTNTITLGTSGDTLNLNTSGATYNVGTLTATNATLNTSATASTALVVNGPTSLSANLLDLQVNGSSKLAVNASGDLTAAKGTFSGDLAIDTSTLFADATNNRVGVGDTTPDYTLEVTSAASADATFALSDGDVAHGLTGIVQTDVWNSLSVLSSTGGGARLTGISDTDAQALEARGVIGSTNPTDATPAVKLVGAKSNGTTGAADLGDLETVFSVANNDDAAAFSLLGNGNASFTQKVVTTGSPTILTVTGAAHTTLTASTEATDININLARTVQFAAGALTTQRAVRVQAPTYGFATSSTITDAATVHIDNEPQAGTNATITNAWALWIDAGAVRFDGVLVTTPSTVQTLTAVGNTIAANAATIQIKGNAAYTLTSTPTIADGKDGQHLYVLGNDSTNTITVQDEGTLPGSNIELATGVTTRVLGNGDILHLIFSSTKGAWVEVSYTNVD